MEGATSTQQKADDKYQAIERQVKCRSFVVNARGFDLAVTPCSKDDATTLRRVVDTLPMPVSNCSRELRGSCSTLGLVGYFGSPPTCELSQSHGAGFISTVRAVNFLPREDLICQPYSHFKHQHVCHWWWSEKHIEHEIWGSSRSLESELTVVRPLHRR
jgi:hypothetical protein